MSIIKVRTQWLSDYDRMIINQIEQEKERMRKEKNN